MKIKLLASIILPFFLCAGFVAAQGDSEKWLTVEVTNQSGQPLRNACVTFVPKEGEIIFRKADSRGKVKLKRPEAQRYRVVVKVDGYEAQKREVSINSKSETAIFTLQAKPE
jgi:hypothetical protein